jgi:hypothetical protein
MRYGALTAVVIALTGALQNQPDFSGRWVLVTSDPAPSHAPRVLVVEQPVTRVNRLGAPMPPAYLSISIRREGASGVTNETRQIGVIGGVVGGAVGRNGSTPGPTSHFETVWRLGMLMFLTSAQGPDGPHTGDWSERSEIWSLDPDGRLRVEIVSEGRDQARQASVSLYRRESPAPAGTQNPEPRPEAGSRKPAAT